jgi:hypothetical protein
MKNIYKYGLILFILILIIVSVGFLAIKKSKSINNTETSVQSSNQNVNQKSQTNEAVKQNIIDNTAKSIQCPDCAGTGQVVCPECEGKGLYYICSACNGKYYTYLNTCPFCGARNTLVHHTCSVTITCQRCGGSGQIPS